MVGKAEFLSPRRLAVVELLSQGLVCKEIATSLGISYQTVKLHVANIKQILHAKTKEHAVAMYVEWKIKGSNSSC